jgi:hypothetical protein
VLDHAKRDGAHSQTSGSVREDSLRPAGSVARRPEIIRARALRMTVGGFVGGGVG